MSHHADLSGAAPHEHGQTALAVRPQELPVAQGDAVRVFILVSVSLYREGLAQCLADVGSISVVGSAAQPAGALALISEVRPDVVLVDVGTDDGPLTARSIREAIPAARIVALAVSSAYADILSWAEAGVSGYVTRDATVDDLRAAIERAADGEIACPPHVVASLLGGLAMRSDTPGPAQPEQVLTAREWQIAQLIQQGLSNKQIASTLTISLPTVKNHVHNVLRKLRVQRRADAVHHVRRLTGPLS